MRRSKFGAVWKHHYTRFPDMPAHLVPEAYDDSSKEAIGVFPIFERFFDRESAGIEQWLVKSACWARRSWLLNTDAVKRGIPLKFFVEDAVMHRVMPLLEANGIGGEHVHVFLGESFRETHKRHFNGAGGKQTAVFSHDAFYDYKWVLHIDADMFVARPPGREGTLGFFQYFSDKTDGLGDFAVVHLHGDKRIGEMRWCVLKEEGKPESREEWYALASRFSGRNIDGGSMFRGLSAAITAYRYRDENRDRLRWITEAGREMHCDEGLFGLMLFMGIPVWGIMNEMKLSGVWDVRDLHKVREAGEFYLAHMGLPHEWDWRADIGVDDV